MPKGLKETSSLIGIGFSLTESAANTFTQERVDLQLNPLDNEVFIVYAIDLDPTPPECITGTNTATTCSITTTSRTGTANLGDSACLANKVLNIESDAVNAVGFSRGSEESPATQLEYLGIISTNDFFVQIQGTNNAGVQAVSGRVYGVRARADASVYAALVQSEVLTQ
jgi:hypothetical protein